MAKFTIKKVPLVGTLVGIGIIILVVAAWSWWRYVYSNPRHVFQRMLATMLSTNSVTKRMSEIPNPDQAVFQTTRLLTTPQHRVYSRNDVVQAGQFNTVVSTENITVPGTDYIRYTHISTNQKTASGKTFDFSKVINVWGKEDKKDFTTGQQQYNQTIFGVVPVNALTPSARADLIKLINDKKVYEVDYGSVTRELKNSRPTFTYKTKLQPMAYVSVLKSFADDLQLKQLQQISPETYKNAKPLALKLVVDVWSGQLREVIYEGQPGQEATHIESFDGYGARVRVDEPSNTIPAEELQKRLQAIQ